MAQLAYSWVVRRPAHTEGPLRANPWLFGALGAALALQVVIVTVPVLASLFDTVALPWRPGSGRSLAVAVGPGLLLAWDRVVPKR